jgi:hypothetical protein
VALLLHFEFQNTRLAAQAQHLADAGRAGVAVWARVACKGAVGGAEGGEGLEAVCAGCGVHFCGLVLLMWCCGGVEVM